MAQPETPITWRALHLAKRGYDADEYEDAFAADPNAGRFAIADAASESSYGRLWARLLVEGFVQDKPQRVRADWLRPLQARWAAAVDGRPLPWYAEMKRDQGAFATFLGLILQPRRKQSGRWRAVAIGDSCLFQVREDTVLTAFPLDRSEDFGSQPDLVGSRPASGVERHLRLKRSRGRWQSGDRFLLMTDALACWFLRQQEQGQQPWAEVARLLAESLDTTFAAWIRARGQREGLRNDDVTLVSVSV
jgi:hypothetical protein